MPCLGRHQSTDSGSCCSLMRTGTWSYDDIKTSNFEPIPSCSLKKNKNCGLSDSIGSGIGVVA